MKNKLIIVVLLLSMYATSNAQKWEIKPGEFGLSEFASDVDPKKPLPEYPRPQMAREQWKNLNGQWDFTVAEKSKSIKDIEFNQKILVPFCMESPISGIGQHLNDYSKVNKLNLDYTTARFWYKTNFTIPKDWKGKNIQLNFGAVDWQSVVYINGKEIGQHKGGYDTFSFDITNYLVKGKKQEIVVSAYDPMDAEPIARGKQKREQSYFYYTPVSGIWQTVWLEPLDELHITNVKFIPNVDDKMINCLVNTSVKGNNKARVTILDKENNTVLTEEINCNTVANFSLKDVQLWSPDNPYLYDVKVELIGQNSESKSDVISTYFGMRKVELKRDAKGYTKIFLNNQAIFQNGVLDQGYWPGGIYTAPTDEALKYDLEMIKKMGFNMSRKHIKVEPQRWYYWADKLGVLVWQDMPASSPPYDSQTARDQFGSELKEMMAELYNHPSVIMWVLFNEGWGITSDLHNGKYDPVIGYNMEHVYNVAKNQDNTRLINVESGSGGLEYQGMNVYDIGLGDIVDFHCYGSTNLPTPSIKRAAVIGEYGYKTYAELAPTYGSLVKKYKVSGVVWTQITNVENEKNGLMTYDRKKVKEGLETVQKINKENFTIKED